LRIKAHTVSRYRCRLGNSPNAGAITRTARQLVVCDRVREMSTTDGNYDHNKTSSKPLSTQEFLHFITILPLYFLKMLYYASLTPNSMGHESWSHANTGGHQHLIYYTKTNKCHHTLVVQSNTRGSMNMFNGTTGTKTCSGNIKQFRREPN
jgi:hypothetical protein